MAKAFLSHSSSDKNIVCRIAHQLGNKNCTLDEISFDPGRKTLEEIFKELDSADVFVLFISDTSLESSWVKKEIVRARENLSKDYIDRILPIIIDENITYADPRIPKWISKPYNLKYISNEVIILKKIKQSLREISFKRNRFNQEIEKIFVGRNNEMQKFETDVNNLDSWTPIYIVAYNYFEGIGRRTFLKNALRKASFMDYLDSPTVITIDSKESIENFIYKLNTLGKNESIMKYDFSSISPEEKVDIAVEQVRQFFDFKELIFIIDDGGIVLPNSKIVDWFTKIVNRDEFDNNLVFCLISRYRPNEITLRKERKSLIYRIPELSNAETKNLFLRLLKIYGLDSIKREDKEFFINNLNGIPAQIIYAVNLIAINSHEAKKNINDIVEYSDNFSATVLNYLKQNEISYQMAILLSKSEIFSVDLIQKIFGETEEMSNALQQLFDLSLFNFVFGNFEYVKLNPTISDYINRSKIRLNSTYNNRLNNITKDLLNEDLDEVIVNDYSEFMLTLQRMLENEISIPKKYFIPSLIIKNIIKEYDKGNYEYVIKICLELLDNDNYDSQIIWETNYRLTLAYARTKNDKFFDYISFFRNEFNNLDYYFLLGFYHRHKGNKSKALEYYYKVLDIHPEHSRTKREIVNILLSQEKYNEALDIAQENYERRKTNIYHIHSYFICLIRKKGHISERELDILLNLMSAVKASGDIKAEDIYRCMKGEFAYYIDDDIQKANDILWDAMRLNDNKNYPKRSLLEIYKKSGMKDAFNELNSEYIVEEEYD
ncbi:hypothetical protein EZS27_027841 [termite gut metagenome]|uniref:TIR domain-containing protein n=1 Tax=termite gut metagenome TaxID=433724 RepID=A0A5J4QL84_9ZZZZ